MKQLICLLKLNYKPSFRKNMFKTTVQIDQNLKRNFEKINAFDYELYNYVSINI